MNSKNKILFGILFLVAASAWSDWAVQIENASELERKLSIQAFGEVKEYYENLGFSIPEGPPPIIIFQDPISISGNAVTHSMGLYDQVSMSVRVIRYKSQKFQQQGYLGDTSLDTYYSIIVHEIAHYMNALVSPDLPNAFNELIAGVVQVELMNPGARRRLLSRGEVIKFSNYLEITLSAYLLHPRKFIVASYYFCKDHPKMLLRFLNQRVPEPIDTFLYD